MRRILIAALSVTLLTATVWAVRGPTTGPTAQPAPAAQAAPDAAAAAHQHPMAARSAGNGQELARQLARARLATARYATSLRTAKAAGYQIITRMMPDMGYHYLNPAIQGFDVTRPHILVYERHGASWQLGALEWVFTAKPATPPLPGATYGSFGAACHYKDGTFVLTASQSDCAERNRRTGATFTFWHPDLVTLHVWLWYPNPAGIYNGTNPYVRPFNAG
jgi:hypothetical protein